MQKGKLAYLQPVPRGMVFVREAVAFRQQGRYSGLAALLQARGLGRNEYREPDHKTLRPNLLA